MNWKAYNDLAWTEHIIASPEDYGEEADHHIQAINEHTTRKSRTLLHIGCGAGGHDYHFKKHFQVTGVDLSKGMLDIASEVNPEATYIEADMRSFDLNETFDIVVFAESIMYMTTPSDLGNAVETAARHLKSDGTMLIVCQPKEIFQENNFAYSGTRDGVHVTLFENNHITSAETYESVMVYLIRENRGLHVEHDKHTIGLFSEHTWLDIFKKEGLDVKEKDMNHLYDNYVLEDGEYPLKMYVLKRK
ncbi:SAM-dependent methyltransferase [Salipaludibacillus keqinensis]|uniref:SAM-dependent methyltransferase n=1 Tax=Salipaludibacillus keqinensis TaxID=2045207 RepID=A0A323T952_9BACI|nr:class I SAM-dependent methyltransferase [Salipaludibacillus keqinensis]PYZ92272.1 SAM-dependent methyltransferase [Salipaludibacillus keqinensis]